MGTFPETDPRSDNFRLNLNLFVNWLLCCCRFHESCELDYVYVIGLHAVQFGNNWMKKIPRRRLSEEFFNSIISKLDTHVVFLLINYIAG